MLLDPSESRLLRLSRWVLALAALAGAAWYGGVSPAGLGPAPLYALAAIGAGMLARSLLVEPILQRLSQLEDKIDRLQRLWPGRVD